MIILAAGTLIGSGGVFLVHCILAMDQERAEWQIQMTDCYSSRTQIVGSLHYTGSRRVARAAECFKKALAPFQRDSRPRLDEEEPSLLKEQKRRVRRPKKVGKIEYQSLAAGQ